MTQHWQGVLQKKQFITFLQWRQMGNNRGRPVATAMKWKGQGTALALPPKATMPAHSGTRLTISHWWRHGWIQIYCVCGPLFSGVFVDGNLRVLLGFSFSSRRESAIFFVLPGLPRPPSIAFYSMCA